MSKYEKASNAISMIYSSYCIYLIKNRLNIPTINSSVINKLKDDRVQLNWKFTLIRRTFYEIMNPHKIRSRKNRYIAYHHQFKSVY